MDNEINESRMNSKLTGLCSNCRHNESCAYMSYSDKKILQCNEFELQDASPVEEVENCISQVSSLPEKKDNATDDPNIYLGLCKNCDKRKDCQYVKPGEGVWHCNEYE